MELIPSGREMPLMDGVMRAMYRDPSTQPRHLLSGQVEGLTNDGDPDIRVATNTVRHAGKTPSLIEFPLLTRR